MAWTVSFRLTEVLVSSRYPSASTIPYIKAVPSWATHSRTKVRFSSCLIPKRFQDEPKSAFPERRCDVGRCYGNAGLAGPELRALAAVSRSDTFPARFVYYERGEVYMVSLLTVVLLTKLWRLHGITRLNLSIPTSTDSRSCAMTGPVSFEARRRAASVFMKSS